MAIPVATDQIINEIFALFAARGQRQYGEDVTELEHALQCALFATEAGEPGHLIVACLLHDYGHLLHNLGEDAAERGVEASHEARGAVHLARYFPPAVVEPIRWHVAAKRFLCWQQPEYFNGLSTASQLSLRLQGGVMSEREAHRFELLPHCAAAIQLRRYDDAGKIPNLVTPTLESYRSLLTTLARL